MLELFLSLIDFSTKGYYEVLYILPEIFIISQILYMMYFLMRMYGNATLNRHIVLSSAEHLQRTLLFVSCAYLFQSVFVVQHAEVYLFDSLFVITPAVLLFKLLISFSSYILLSSFRVTIFLKFWRTTEYFCLVGFAIFYLLLLVQVNHLLVFFILLIGVSIVLYSLILYDAQSIAIREAGLKYYYLSTISTAVMFLGFALLSFTAPSLYLNEVAWLVADLSSIAVDSSLLNCPPSQAIYEQLMFTIVVLCL
jgi:NADH:ubiquinone oxidoreductase subunit 2 (subunit N)